MSSRSPEQYVPNQPDSQDKNSHSINLGFFKTLTEKRTARDGNHPKRRGPKPDSKPALTRRQELNRQAQRTHRERKELYIKALEDEVLRLKEIFTNMSQDKEKLAEENKQLKQILTHHGINWSSTAGIASPQTSNIDDFTNINYSASSTGGYGQKFTPPLTSNSTAPSVTSNGAPHHASPHSNSHTQPISYTTTKKSTKANIVAQHMPPMLSPPQHQLQQAGSSLDFDQAGIDFVLTYDDPSQAYMSPPHH